MAYMNPSAIRGAIIERIEGTIQGARSVPMGEAEADIIDHADDSTKAVRALIRPVFTVEMEFDRNEASPQGPTSLYIWDAEVTIKFTYNLKGHEPNSTDYADRKAVAEKHLDMFAQALTEPNTLGTQLSTGTSTNISSGCLRTRSPAYRIVNDDPAGAIFEVEQNYKAIVIINSPTSS